MLKLLWYLTISSAIWTTYFGSISTVAGEVYPFQIFVLINSFVMIFKKEFRVNDIIKFSSLLFSVMLIYGITSLFWVNDLSISIKKVMHLLTGVLFLFQFIIIVNNHLKLKKSIQVFSVNFYVVLLIGIIEIMSGNYLHATHYIQTNNLNSLGLHFPLVMFNNTNDLAVFILLFSPVALYNLSGLKKFKQIITIIIYTIIAFVIFNTESRLGSTLIVLYGALYFYYSMLNHVKSKKLKLSFLLLSISVVSLLLIFESAIFNNILDAIKNDVRITIYKIAFDSFSETLTFGLGIGSLYNITTINIHNYILEILFEFGLFIFVLYFSWLVFIYIKLNNIKNDIFSEDVFIFYLKVSILLIPFWGGISSTITSNPYIWIFYALLVATASNLSNIGKSGEK